jgi:hypothetical protein
MAGFLVGLDLVQSRGASKPDRMTDAQSPFSDLGLQHAIELRWILRDIKAKRSVLSPINPAHLQTLRTMGLVEMRHDHPVLTNSGLDVIS